MSGASAKLDILIDIQAKLAELLKTQQGFRDAKAEAQSFGTLLKEGLGIGTGMEMARRGIELVKEVIVDSAREAFQLAGQLKDTAENIQITTEALQVLQLAAEDGGASVDKMNEALVHLKQAGTEARSGVGEIATIFNDLNIDAAKFADLPMERQMEKFAQAVFAAKDPQKAFNETLQVIGTRTAPQLMNALRDLSTEGYDKLAAAARDSGRIMEQETIERLDRAQKQIERVKRAMVIFAGESIAALSSLVGMGGGDVGKAALFTTSGDFWTLFNQQQLRAGDAQLNMLKERFALMQALHQDSPFSNITANSEVIMLTQMRDLLLQNIRAAAHELPAAFQKLGTVESGRMPRSIQEMFPPNVGTNGNTLNDVFRGLSDENLKKIEAVNHALAELGLLLHEIQQHQAPLTAFDRLQMRFNGINDPRKNENYMTPMQGAVGGAMQWATSLGSVGEQVASQIDNTIGTSVHGVSQELANWAVTGKMSGDALAQLGMSVFTGWIQGIIQMGVQWLVTQTLIKTGLLTTDALQSGLLVKKTAEVNAANAATLPANTANAAASSVSSFGLAAVLGLAAMLAIMAMFGGFRETGGDAQAGRAYIVGEKRPEVFVPTVSGKIVPSVSQYTRTSPGMGAAQPVAASKAQVFLFMAPTQQLYDQMRRNPDYEVHQVDIMMRHRGDLVNS